MSPARRSSTRSLAVPIAVSALLHGALIAPLVLLHADPPKLLPPMYRVELIAAAAGPRAAGVVSESPVPVATAPPKTVPKAVPLKARAPVKGKTSKAVTKSTPAVAPAKALARVADAPRAAGGAHGGAGADVVSVSTAGIVFPYKGYLDNIVRQIALNFTPRGNVGALRAEVAFVIRRDGTVFNFLWLNRSGSMAFDLEAQGAVEAASRGFGPLPVGFSDDVLPVIFYFDPSKLR